MNKLNVNRLLSIAVFAGLALFSCYWTAESLYLWQPTIGRLGGWLIAVSFYAAASLCFSLVMRALDKNRYFGNSFGGRGGQLTLGVVGMIVFWLCFSMPTNTHTLLYHASIKDIAQKDVRRTLGYLEGMTNQNSQINKLERDYESKEAMVRNHLSKMNAEISNPNRLGIGRYFENELVALETELGVTFQRVQPPSQSMEGWQLVYNNYRRQADDALRNIRASTDEKINRVKATIGSGELSALIARCNASLNDLDKMDGTNEEVMNAIVKDLRQCYSFISTNQRYITFEKGDKEKYTKEGAVSDTQAMFSVPDVWKDYINTDKFDGHGFFWWVLLALGIDLLAFIFFYVAQKSENNII